MKFFFSLLLPCFIYAQNSDNSSINKELLPKKQVEKESSLEIKPIAEEFTQDEIILYKKAVNAFQNKKYQIAYDIFSTLYLEHLDDVKINFYLGRSAFEIKKYNQAYAAYQRILIKDENNQRVRLEMGRILYMLKSYDDALKEFERVLKYPIPTQVRNNIQSLIAEIENKKKKYFLNGALQFGWGHDDNINNNSYLDYTTYGSSVLTNDTKKVKDSFNKLVMVLNLVIPFKKDKRFAYEGSIIGYSQNYQKEHYKNIGLISLSNGISFVQDKYKLSANLLTDKIWYGSEPLLTNIGISPKITYLYNKDLMFDGLIKYVRKSMSKESDKNKDANIRNITFNVTKKLKKSATVSLKTYLTTERKIRGVRSDVDKNVKGIKLSYSREFIPTVNTVLSYGYDKSNYKEADPNLPAREDVTDTYGIVFTKPLDKSSNISLEYSYIDVVSNIESNTYEKNTFGITYTKTF